MQEMGNVDTFWGPVVRVDAGFIVPAVSWYMQLSTGRYEVYSARMLAGRRLVEIRKIY